MNPGEELHPGTGDAVTAGAAGRGPAAHEARDTGGQVLWGVWRVFIVILAACLGAAAVEAARALL